MSRAAIASPPPDIGWSKACGVCRRRYDERTWRDLPEVTTVPPNMVQDHLTVPATWRVEVRRCACGAALAARH